MSSRLAPPLVLAVLALIFFAPLLLHPTYAFYGDYSDFLAEYVPVKRYLVGTFQRTGELPLWCPYSLSGLPVVHDIQACAFYPPHLPLYWIPEEHQGAALSWLIVLHVLLAGWCMYAYARWRGLDRVPAFVAGLGYMFAGKWLLHLLAAGHSNFTPLAWLPLVLLLFEGALGRRSPLRAIAAGVVFALIVLGTHPQLTFYAGLFIAVWTLGPALEGRTNRSLPTLTAALARWAAYGLLMALVAGALSAVQLLPTLEAVRQMSRGNTSMHISSPLFTLKSALHLIGPASVGSTWECRSGLGILWVTAAVLAAVRGGKGGRFQMSVVLVMLAFILGGWFVVEKLPGFGLFRLPTRVSLIAALPLALLAGTATQYLFTTPADGSVAILSRRVVWSIPLVGVLLLAGQLAFDEGINFPVSWAVAAVVLLVGVTLLLRFRGSVGPAWKTAWVGLLLAELWGFALPLVHVRDDAEIFAPTESIRFLAAHREDLGRTLDHDVPGHQHVSPVGVMLPVVHGIDIVRGYNPIDIYRYKEYLQFLADRDVPPPSANVTSDPLVKNRALLDLLGTRFLAQPSAWPPPGAGWEAVAVDEHPAAFCFLQGGVVEMPPYTIYQNHQALPRAFVVPSASPLPQRSQLLAALQTTDFRRTVLLEGSPPEPAEESSRGGCREAIVQDYGPNRIRVEVQGSAPGYLVLTDPWYPGWEAAIDGVPTTVYRANYLFRAVRVPAGRHEVVFTFAPASYFLGRRISLLAFALTTVVLTLGGLLTWRRPTRAQPV